jgi:hypothetical protein
MNMEDFQKQLKALGEKWGTPYRGLFTAVSDKWWIDIYKNGLKEEIKKLESKSVPFYEIFLKPRLIGKTYLIYQNVYPAPHRLYTLIGLLQSSKIDFDNFQYCYLVADDMGDMLIGESGINFSNKPNLKGKYPVVTEEYKENQKKSFLDEVFVGKIWTQSKGGLTALDVSYLIGNSDSIFMNWDSNPLEGEK